MRQNGVYRLETYRFLKKYARFMRSDPRTFPEFYPDKYGNGEWRPPRLAAAWKPQRLIGEVWAENDYPGEGAPAYLVPVFSPRAVEGLREFLEPNGELLPVITALGIYYAYNVTTVVQALDRRKSEIVWKRGSKHRVNGIVRFEFKPKMVEKLAIFKIPQLPEAIHVTEPFVRRVRELGLNGMWMTKCWPVAKGVRWREVWEDELEEMKAEAEKTQAKSGSFRGLGKAVRVPKVLDLRKDAEAMENLLRRVVRWVELRQKGWAATGEFVSAIGLEIIGWGVRGGPIVMGHVDTRERHEMDGRWSHFQVARIARPQWSAVAGVLEESDVERAVIDARGKNHAIQTYEQMDKLLNEAMVAALEQAKRHDLFKGLLKRRGCRLCAVNTESGFVCSRRETTGVDSRAE